MAALLLAACSSSSPSSPGEEDGGTLTDAGGDPLRCASPPCANGQRCVDAVDCSSGHCGSDKLCIATTGSDGKKDGDETDVDCGGDPGGAPRCEDNRQCRAASDCASSVCTGGVCQVPTHTDGVKNGDETGKDCGGPTSGKTCNDGEGCADGQGTRDCASGVCTGSVCQAPSHTDGVKNGDETGKDCGGPTIGKTCNDGEGCVVGQAARDCTSKVCTGSVCQAPTFTDGVKNGTETDVDCGGAAAGTRCLAGKVCVADSDCNTRGCSTITKTCAWGRSCTLHHGHDTCGVGDETFTAQAGATFTSLRKDHHDCCESAVVDPNGVPNSGDEFRLDKYQVTAGRMRRFIEATGGNVRKWVQDARGNLNGESFKDPGAAAQLPATFDQYLPQSLNGTESAPTSEPVPGHTKERTTSIVSVAAHLGGYRYTNEPGGAAGYGCSIRNDGFGSRTYRLATDELVIGGERQHALTQSRLDQKSLTCVDYYLLAAFCAWDGGRLETKTEHATAWGTGTYPWGNDGGTQGFSGAIEDVRFNGNGGNTLDVLSDRTPASPGNFNRLFLERVNVAWNYGNYIGQDYRRFLEGRPNNGQSYAGESEESYGTYDQSYAVAPPGRYPSGAGPWGHMDLLGNVIEITAETENVNGVTAYRWTKNGSFEWYTHFDGAIGYNGYRFAGLAKYGRTGGRCARPLAQP